MQNKVREAIDMIKAFYVKKKGTIVIAFSGGKDSTTVYQLFVMALTEIPVEQRVDPIYLEYCDTLLEAPPVKDYIESQIKSIRQQITELELPIKVVELKPAAADTFFVNIIGKGYSAPTPNFRWCSDRLKRQPSKQFIKDCLSDSKTVYVVTGARSSESSNRAKTLKRYTLNGKIKVNASQPGSFIFTPIEDWTTNDVWDFLGEKALFNNEAIETLYEESKEDRDVYGGNRQGCWSCTVVHNDKALEQFVKNGYALKPLLEYRKFLKEFTYDPSNRHAIRRKGETAHSLLSIRARIRLLERLLLTQKEVGYQLISDDELRVIDTLWQADQSPINVRQVIKTVSKGRTYAEQQSFRFNPPMAINKQNNKGTIHDLLNDLWEPNHFVEIFIDQKGLKKIRKGTGDWININRQPVWAIHDQEDIEYDIMSFNMGRDLLRSLGAEFVDDHHTLTSDKVIRGSMLMENSFWRVSKEADGMFYCALGVRIPSMYGGKHLKILGLEKGENLNQVILKAREKFVSNSKFFKVINQTQAALVIEGKPRKITLTQAMLDKMVEEKSVLALFMALHSIRADFMKLTFDPREIDSMSRFMLNTFAYAYGGYYDIRKRALSFVLIPRHNIQEFGGIAAISLGKSVVKIEFIKSKYKYNPVLIEEYEQNRLHEEALLTKELTQEAFAFGA